MLGLALKKGWLQGAEAVKRASIPQAPTETMVEEMKKELNSEDCTAVQDLYFCWARR